MTMIIVMAIILVTSTIAYHRHEVDDAERKRLESAHSKLGRL